MKIKICGLKDTNNIRQVSEANPDYMGFIFYPKSPRYVGQELSKDTLETIPESIVKTAVFVDESVENIMNKVNNYGFEAIQLHGDESPAICKELKEQNLTVIKAFAIEETFDFTKLIPYETHCDYFLFDTKTPAFGGSGKTFDWTLLSQHQLVTPFFLSGGLGVENLDAILKLKNDKLYGLDFNSKLEDAPGLKNIQMINKVLDTIRNYEHI
ncbi:phosphoribosylanthranilate isomerase [Planktosalinus lacus]|uniref:N-(5'-phosphoribosyl)anthranilate isomerase n=1 Tax=Planktosalinus lacus TaxID=1526573 RepID=A0A8J2VBC6_9FLAO|nr:phosphoribosylanthranilate isomerase [Planktosalinus lacus]GGD96945.1 N-(5'-phosphoribosyl)anthranilate isomerase [Planktosalinus lacus]